MTKNLAIFICCLIALTLSPSLANAGELFNLGSGGNLINDLNTRSLFGSGGGYYKRQGSLHSIRRARLSTAVAREQNPLKKASSTSVQQSDKKRFNAILAEHKKQEQAYKKALRAYENDLKRQEKELAKRERDQKKRQEILKRKQDREALIAKRSAGRETQSPGSGFFSSGTETSSSASKTSTPGTRPSFWERVKRAVLGS